MLLFISVKKEMVSSYRFLSKLTLYHRWVEGLNRCQLHSTKQLPPLCSRNLNLLVGLSKAKRVRERKLGQSYLKKMIIILQKDSGQGALKPSALPTIFFVTKYLDQFCRLVLLGSSYAVRYGLILSPKFS